MKTREKTRSPGKRVAENALCVIFLIAPVTYFIGPFHWDTFFFLFTLLFFMPMPFGLGITECYVHELMTKTQEGNPLPYNILNDLHPFFSTKAMLERTSAQLYFHNRIVMCIFPAQALNSAALALLVDFKGYLPYAVICILVPASYAAGRRSYRSPRIF